MFRYDWSKREKKVKPGIRVSRMVGSEGNGLGVAFVVPFLYVDVLNAMFNAMIVMSLFYDGSQRDDVLCRDSRSTRSEEDGSIVPRTGKKSKKRVEGRRFYTPGILQLNFIFFFVSVPPTSSLLTHASCMHSRCRVVESLSKSATVACMY